MTTIADLTRDEPTPLPGEHVDGLPAELETTIMRCLEPDPARRPPSAAALAEELGAPAAAPTLSRRPTEVVRVHRSRSRAWLAAAAAAALVAVVAALALRDGDEAASGPPAVAPVPTGAGPAEDARSLAEWLRANAG